MSDDILLSLARAYHQDPSDRNAHALARAYVRACRPVEVPCWVADDAPKVESIGRNMTQATVGPHTVLISYETPVAFHCDGCSIHVNGDSYRVSPAPSRTTGRHIGTWFREHIGVPHGDAEPCAQSYINEHALKPR